MFGDDILSQLQAAVALPVPEAPQGLQDAKAEGAIKEQADWLKRLRDDIRQIIEPSVSAEAEDELHNRLSALEDRISALSVAPRMPPPVLGIVDATEEALVVRLQAAIASGAAGNVKRCYWKSATSEWIEYGSAFSAHNAGPKDAPDDAVVLLVPRYTNASLPVFQYGTGADVAATTSVIDARSASAGSAVTAMRSDAWPGLKLVGDPADFEEPVAGGNFVPTIEAVKDDAAPVVRRGFRARLGAVDYGYLAASYAHLLALAAGANVTKTGLMVPLVTTGCLKGTVNGLDVNIGDGLEIDANVLKAVWVADP